MILAGHETTATALFWALYLLALDPATQDEVAQEALGAAACGEFMLERLKLTRAVIDETMRLYPPAFLIARAAAAPDEIMGNPVLMSPSVQRTIVVTTDFFGLLFERVREPFTEAPPTTRTLVVDDDPISNRLVVSALRNVQLEARSTEDPMLALQWLQQTKYDLVLLDIEMPKLDGFEFCKRMRTFPGHRETPVIYVTVHTDFESRAKGVLSGGDDLIAKPVFPIELAVKATMHLLKRHLAETQRPAENG